MILYEVKQYINENEQIVMAKIPVTNPDAVSFVKTIYQGNVMLRTPQGAMPFPFDFPDGLTLEQCFEQYEEVAKKAVDELKQKLEDANRIIPASGMPNNGGLILPRK